MKSIMIHLVAGYPDTKSANKLFNDLISAKVQAIELQIPFSDPIADGPVIMAANDQAVTHGVGIDEALSLLEGKLGKSKVYIMSYLQPILSYGPNQFFDKASKAAGFIIPDLPFDAPEIDQFLLNHPELMQKLVPVLSTGMPHERLKQLFATLEPELVYVTARHGITGDKTSEFDDELLDFINDVKNLSSADIALGFGIQTPADVKKAAKIADLPVVGSAISKIADSPKKVTELINDLARAAKMV